VSDAAHMLGRYRLIAEIGRGGMATVYLAVAQGMARVHKLLVIKELLPEFATDPRYVQMFLSEARLATRLHHPNIVQTIEIGQDGSRYYLVMEYLAGQPLNTIGSRAHKKSVEFPLRLRLRVISEVLAALHYLHELQDYGGTKLDIVHRDVSPHNIFVTYDGAAKLMDFGVAKVASAGGESVVGKAQYMAPEQARAERIDRRADVFSMGVILWEAIAKRRLWKGSGTDEIFRELLKRSPMLPIRSVVPDVPDALAAICARALAMDVHERYADCLVFQTDLDRFVATLPEGPASMRELGSFVGELFASTRQRADHALHERLHLLETSGELHDILPSGQARGSTPAPLPRADAVKTAVSIPVPAPEPPPALAPILQRLHDIPKLESSALFDAQGRLLAVSPGQEPPALQAMMGTLCGCFDALTSLERPATLKRLTLVRFQHRSLLLRRSDQISLLVLAGEGCNLNQVNVAVNAAMLKIPSVLYPKVETASGAVPSPNVAPLDGTDSLSERSSKVRAAVPAETLKTVTDALARLLGPMARVLVRRALAELGASAGTLRPEQLDPLINAVSTSVGDTRRRAQFVEEARRGVRL
jgi:serine/threonine protein kinase